MSTVAWFFVPLVFGGAAGYLLNRIALVYLSRYISPVGEYGGFVGLLLHGGDTKRFFSGDMIVVEAAASFLTAAAVAVHGVSSELLFILPIVYLIILLSLIDSRIRILPNQLNLAGIVIGVCYAFVREDFTSADALLGILTGGGFSAATAFLYQAIRAHEGLGLGDVKLLAFFGSFAGWDGVLLIIMAGSLMGAVWGMYAAFLAKKKDMMRHEVPFGPFLGLAALGYLFFVI